jgi:hypothetical protein
VIKHGTLVRAFHLVHYKKYKILLENVMKKVLSVLAMAAMIVGLAGCMDDPDGSKQTVGKHVSRNN